MGLKFFNKKIVLESASKNKTVFLFKYSLLNLFTFLISAGLYLFVNDWWICLIILFIKMFEFCLFLYFGSNWILHLLKGRVVYFDKPANNPLQLQESKKINETKTHSIQINQDTNIFFQNEEIED